MSVEIIKIGGSVMFEAGGKLKTEAVKPILNVVAQMQTKVILVIGCGDNMHQRTIEANLTDKPGADKDGQELKMGDRMREFFALYQEVQKNLLEVCSLNNSREFTPIHPAHIFIKRGMGTNSHEIIWFDRGQIEQYYLPVTSGGIVHDKSHLFSAISSDTIAAYLANQFMASRLIFLTETNGIYPSLNNPTTIPIISPKDLNKYQIGGGMRDKLRRISYVNLTDIEVIISGSEADIVQKLMLENITNHCTIVVTSQ